MRENFPFFLSLSLSLFFFYSFTKLNGKIGVLSFKGLVCVVCLKILCVQDILSAGYSLLFRAAAGKTFLHLISLPLVLTSKALLPISIQVPPPLVYFHSYTLPFFFFFFTIYKVKDEARGKTFKQKKEKL